MSQANVEIVRRGFEHFVATGEPLWETLDEEIVVRDHDIPDAGDYLGYAGLARWGEDWDAAWEDWRWEPEEFIDVGDRVVGVLRVYAKGRGSGVDVERVDGAVWTLRHGKCIRLDYYGSKDQALKAVGLAEQAMSHESVELFRRGIEHFMRTGEPLWETLDEQIEIHDHDILDAREYRGHAGWTSWFEDWEAAFAESTVEPDEFIDVDDDHVIVVFRLHATGRGSGVKVERQDAMLVTMRDGKAVRIDYFNSKQQALKAVGLEE